jgi:hypothetical protein
MPILDFNTATASLTGVGTFGGLVPVSGDTLTVRSFTDKQNARLLAVGAKHATAGSARVRSPYLHDPTNGIRFRTLSQDASSGIDEFGLQWLRAQDTLIFEATGGASAEQVSGWYLAYYDYLGGSPSTYITTAELKRRVKEYVTNENPVTGGAAATYGTALLSAGTGELKANQWYAIIGYVLDVACTGIAIAGPDTGNFKCGGPGLTTKQFTRKWFSHISDATGLPTIPVINSTNAGGTTIYVVDSAGATAVNVDLVLARLGPSAAPAGA